MEDRIKKALGTSRLERMGRGGGGCISEGEGYHTDFGDIFVKRNSKPNARLMFDGELEGLKALFASQMVRVPKPYLVLDDSHNAVIVMEYLNMSTLSTFSTKLGEQLAKLHLCNENLLKKLGSSSIHSETKGDEDEYHLVGADKFGFHTTTCCGYIPLDNTWCSDWVEFFAKQRLQLQIQMIEEKYGDREAIQLWSQLQLNLSDYFREIEIKPALLHGDLWSGNVAEIESCPVIFDPAVFYGHSEFDLSIASMFGGFNYAFYNAYHGLIPKAVGFEKRQQIYCLFHYLNHWNHFGEGYRRSSISILKRLIKH